MVSKIPWSGTKHCSPKIDLPIQYAQVETDWNQIKVIGREVAEYDRGGGGKHSAYFFTLILKSTIFFATIQGSKPFYTGWERTFKKNAESICVEFWITSCGLSYMCLKANCSKTDPLMVSQVVLRRAPICKQANQSGQMNWSTKPCQSVRESGLSVSQLMESLVVGPITLGIIIQQLNIM